MEIREYFITIEGNLAPSFHDSAILFNFDVLGMAVTDMADSRQICGEK